MNNGNCDTGRDTRGSVSKPASLTEAGIGRALATAVPNSELRLYDSRVSGLLLWRRANGKPRWYVFMRAGGRMRRVPVGDLNAWPAVTVDQARTLAKGIVAALAAGSDPVKAKAERRTAARGGRFPLQDVVKAFVKRLTTKGRSPHHIAEIQRIGDALIAKGLRDLADYKRARSIAEDWINGQDIGDLTKHRYGVQIKSLGRAALSYFDDLPRDPFRSVAVGSATLPAPAMFTLPEIIRLASDDAMGTDWGKLFVFLLFTGARLREGEYARWSRINLDDATFAVLPPTADQRAQGEAVKRDKGRSVTLQAEMVEILRSWKKSAKPEEDFIFPDQCRTSGKLTTFSFRDHLEHLKILVDGRHIHTLRHSHCALAVACGVKDMELRLSVGHGGPEMTRHYANAAMLWRGKLRDWDGVFRLRDPAEVARLTVAEREVAS